MNRMARIVLDPNRTYGRYPYSCTAVRVTTSTTPSNTSQRLRALLSQLDHADTPDASNAAMHLIAEAAIEASDYSDAA